MKQTTDVVIPYKQRDQFKPYHRRKERFACLVYHRRAGKTVAVVNDLIRDAMSVQLPRPRVAYIAPLYRQAKQAAWDYAKHYSRPIPGAQFSESELRIDYPNGGRLQLFGADNPDSMRGMYFDAVALDEYAQMPGSMWTEVIRPALADRKGRATFIGTPKGENAFYDIWQDAQKYDDWFAQMLRASESDLIDDHELEMARLVMAEPEYQQEFECSFAAALVGAYYGAEMEAADRDGRIASVVHDPACQVETWWDLGFGDVTSIWFMQRVGTELHAIDYYEASGVGFDHYAKVLKDKPYIYSRHVAPHDIVNGELGTGKSRQDVARSLGINFVVAPKLAIEDRITAARLLIPRVWFDKTKCAPGVKALRNYQREWDEKMNTFKPRPRHDWASHAADAFGYGATMRDLIPRGVETRRRYGGNQGRRGSWMAA